jgi:hypothetical protein
MSTSPPTSRLDAALVCCFVTVAVAACAALAGAAALVPAPPVVLPLIGAICTGCALVVPNELRSSHDVVRRHSPLGRRDLLRLRRELYRLPET